ncbi:MAG: monovalent cation/H(+) antiporter subunit G [Microthrixaceae bacterium]
MGEVVALVGSVFVLVSAIGVVRFDDVLARLHALSKASTLGVLLILGGAAVDLQHINDVTSVVLASVLHLLMSPPAANMLSRATYLISPLPDDAIDEHRDASAG